MLDGFRIRPRPGPEIACTECAARIGAGEKYVAFNRHVERVDRDGAVTVDEAEMVTAYHLMCAPDRLESAA
jgi:hypothetical protein